MRLLRSFENPLSPEGLKAVTAQIRLNWAVAWGASLSPTDAIREPTVNISEPLLLHLM
jgi:hypothetical protein